MTLRYIALEARRAFRNRRFLIFTVIMPVALFLLYSQIWQDGISPDGVSTAAYLMTSMAAFGAMSGSMSTGMRVAQERASGWNRQLRLTPLRPSSYLIGKGIVGMLVALPALVLVYLAAVLVEHVDLSIAELLTSGALTWLAIIPFAVLGLVIGYLATPDSAQPIYMICFMLMSFLGGILIPLQVFPDSIANVAHIMPSYWLALLARTPLGDAGIDWTAVPVLLAWTLVLGFVVMRRYRNDTARA